MSGMRRFEGIRVLDITHVLAGPFGVPVAPPAMGADNDANLAELGYTDSNFSGLRARRAI